MYFLDDALADERARIQCECLLEYFDYNARVARLSQSWLGDLKSISASNSMSVALACG